MLNYCGITFTNRSQLAQRVSIPTIRNYITGLRFTDRNRTIYQELYNRTSFIYRSAGMAHIHPSTQLTSRTILCYPFYWPKILSRRILRYYIYWPKPKTYQELDYYETTFRCMTEARQLVWGTVLRDYNYFSLIEARQLIRNYMTRLLFTDRSAALAHRRPWVHSVVPVAAPATLSAEPRCPWW